MWLSHAPLHDIYTLLRRSMLDPTFRKPPCMHTYLYIYFSTGILERVIA